MSSEGFLILEFARCAASLDFIEFVGAGGLLSLLEGVFGVAGVSWYLCGADLFDDERILDELLVDLVLQALLLDSIDEIDMDLPILGVDGSLYWSGLVTFESTSIRSRTLRRLVNSSCVLGPIEGADTSSCDV